MSISSTNHHNALEFVKKSEYFLALPQAVFTTEVKFGKTKQIRERAGRRLKLLKTISKDLHKLRKTLE